MRSVDTNGHGSYVGHCGLQGMLAVTLDLGIAGAFAAIVALAVHTLAEFLVRTQRVNK